MSYAHGLRPEFMFPNGLFIHEENSLSMLASTADRSVGQTLAA